jgi:hypothetical protein
MKKRVLSHRLFGFVAIVSLILMSLCAAISILFFFKEKERKPEQLLSPSGNRVILATVNRSKEDMTTYLCIKLEIKDLSANKILFNIQTHASDRMRWSIHWLGEDSILLESSDIGDRCWKEISGGVWKEAECPHYEPKSG